ncbi:EpsG family protein [Vibrio lentus]|uniref:EpsG family protein n=1 Tax=Vibrio lentus TaxID=136468 RepID=A0A2N7IA72_9VIBR|nr:EpsG family protein [Vibrio lentus]PML53296.1 hypothetical protein BCT74_12335 [Vibrio lentus]PMM38479.1 hypothetical protein BCT58_24065 [Vibrio lentus]
MASTIIDYILISLCFFNLCIFASCIDKYRNNKRVFVLKFIFWALIFFVSYLIIFRGDYPDVDNYKFYFENAPIDFNFSDIENRDIEIGYYFFSSFTKLIGLNFDVASFLMGFISIFFVYFGFRLYPDIAYSATALLVTFSYAISFMIQVRQGVALSFSVCTVIYFLNKRYIRSFLFYLLACLFHISAILIFPIIVFCVFSRDLIYRNRFIVVYFSVLLACLFSYFDFVSMIAPIILSLLDERLLSKFYLYTEYINSSVRLLSVTNILMLLIIFISAIFFNIRRYKFDRELFSLLITCFLMYNLLSFSSDVASRFYKILSVAIPIQLSFMLQVFTNRAGVVGWGVWLVIVFFICAFYQLNFLMYNLPIFNF